MTGTEGAFSASEILSQLDEMAEAFDFPMLDNAFVELADVRLTAFRGDYEWLIVIEEVSVFQGQSFMNTVSAYGNGIAEQGTQLGIDDFITSAPGNPIWNESGDFALDVTDFEIVINGQHRNFTPSREELDQVGREPDSDVSNEIQLLRVLTLLIPESILLSDERLLEICGRSDAGLTRLLQLDDWYHPNVAIGEQPSENECLESLADALAAGDADLYSCPEELQNTHWSYWVQ